MKELQVEEQDQERSGRHQLDGRPPGRHQLEVHPPGHPQHGQVGRLLDIGTDLRSSLALKVLSSEMDPVEIRLIR